MSFHASKVCSSLNYPELKLLCQSCAHALLSLTDLIVFQTCIVLWGLKVWMSFEHLNIRFPIRRSGKPKVHWQMTSSWLELVAAGTHPVPPYWQYVFDVCFWFSVSFVTLTILFDYSPHWQYFFWSLFLVFCIIFVTPAVNIRGLHLFI